MSFNTEAQRHEGTEKRENISRRDAENAERGGPINIQPCRKCRICRRNSDEQQRATLTLRLGLRGYRSLTQANRFLERPLRGLVVAAGRRGLRTLPLGWGRGVRSMWRNVSGAFVAHRSLLAV